MKKFITTSAISLLLLPALHAESPKATPDTVFTASNVSTAILTESPTGVTLSLIGSADDEQYFEEYTTEYSPDAVVTSSQRSRKPWTYSRDGKSDVVIQIGGLHFGFVDALGAPGIMDQQMGRSFELGIDECLAVAWASPSRTTHIGAGVGVNWRNYRLSGDTRYIVDNGVISFGEYPEGTTPQFSNLKIFSVGFPIYWSQVFQGIKIFGNHPLGFKFAVNLNWNSHASLTTKYLLPDGYQAKEATKHVGQRPFTVDLQMSVFPADFVGLYVRYTPMSALSAGRGPSFTTLSTGVTLCF